jgi:hypothetical protein
VNAPELFFILSMQRTVGDCRPVGAASCVWWRPNANGYTSSIGEAGRYTREEALRHSDPPHHLVIPCSAVEVPASHAKRLAKHALKESRFDVKPREPIVHRSAPITVPAAVADAVSFEPVTLVTTTDADGVRFTGLRKGGAK